MTGPLGTIVVLTDRIIAAAAGHDLVSAVRAAVCGGATAVIFREKDLDSGARLALGCRLADAVTGTGTRLVVASDASLARSLGASGVHLGQLDESVGEPDGTSLIVGRSCHDAAEVAVARTEGVAYVTVSPVFATTSKPGYGPPLGPAAVGALDAAGATTPAVYALGGVNADNAAACLRAGSTGVAVMGAVMASPDPRLAVERLVAATASVVEAAP